MDDLAGILVLLGLAVLAVPVLLVVALVSISGLKRRIGDLERKLAQVQAQAREAAGTGEEGSTTPTGFRGAAAAAPVGKPPAGQPSRTQTQSPPSQPPGPADPPTHPASTSRPLPPAWLAGSDPAPASAGAPGPDPLGPGVTATPGAQPPPLPSERPVAAAAQVTSRAWAPPPSDQFRVLARAVGRWFSVGNVPVKIGMLVLLAGVAALLKYASDQGWMRVPVELRLAGVALAAMAGLVFGWRQRADKPAFALAVQGGAIGVLLLTVFAAFKLELMAPLPALLLSVVLVAGLCVLAVLQHSRTLAVLGILAGFMAPIWLSTGSGNHVALFSYYALFNAAILAIAWWRPWRVLNLLGFVFTFGIGTVWGVLQYDPSKLASTQPFLLLFLAFYLAIPLLYARKRPASRGDFFDGCLVFGTPLVVFTLQAALLDDLPGGSRAPLALCALAVAVLYLVLAWLFIRRERYAALGQSYALLAVGFATLAVPLALSARATAAVFALEGAALVWLGLRQRRWLPQAAGAGLQLAAAVGLLIGASDPWPGEQALANPTFMGALLIALAGFASAWSYRDRARQLPALGYYLWGLGWWCGAGFNEIARFVADGSQADASLAWVGLTGWLAAEFHRRQASPALVLTTLAALVAALPLALAQTVAHQHPFAGLGGWAWLWFAMVGVRSLLCLRGGGDRLAGWVQVVWWLLWPAVLSLLGPWLASRFGLAQAWELALVALPWLLVLAASLFRWPWLAAPLGARMDPLRGVLQVLLLAVLGLWWFVALWQPGASAPLAWLPLLNPMELAQLAFVVLAAVWLWSPQAPALARRLRVFKLAAAGFLMVTATTLRAVHHWGAVPWNPELLSTSLAQTSLTVVWSVLGVLGWVLGSRRGQRGLWLSGAVLMAVVLAKLVLVDRDNLGDVLGIASFIAYGLLCTVVGYLAPAPPRGANQERMA